MANIGILKPPRSLARTMVLYLSLMSLHCVLLGCRAADPISFHGRIVDEVSGEPLRDAVVVVTWCKRPRFGMEHPQSFYSGVEVSTDVDGMFQIATARPRIWNPLIRLSNMSEPKLAIVRSGYRPVTELSRQGLLAQLREGRVVALERHDVREGLKGCGYPTNPCPTGEGILYSCQPTNGSLPVFEAYLVKERADIINRQR